MRLIDADALKENVFDYAPPEMTWDRGDIEHKIQEMPTIDAIPVEWIKDYLGKNEYDGNINTVVVIEEMLFQWKKEQGAR